MFHWLSTLAHNTLMVMRTSLCTMIRGLWHIEHTLWSIELFSRTVQRAFVCVCVALVQPVMCKSHKDVAGVDAHIL